MASVDGFILPESKRSFQNGWNYDDNEFGKWYSSTRPNPKDKIIPVGSVDETVAKIWSYLPLK